MSNSTSTTACPQRVFQPSYFQQSLTYFGVYNGFSEYSGSAVSFYQDYVSDPLVTVIEYGGNTITSAVNWVMNGFPSIKELGQVVETKVVEFVAENVINFGNDIRAKEVFRDVVKEKEIALLQGEFVGNYPYKYDESNQYSQHAKSICKAVFLGISAFTLSPALFGVSVPLINVGCEVVPRALIEGGRDHQMSYELDSASSWDYLLDNVGWSDLLYVAPVIWAKKTAASTIQVVANGFFKFHQNSKVFATKLSAAVITVATGVNLDLNPLTPETGTKPSSHLSKLIAKVTKFVFSPVVSLVTFVGSYLHVFSSKDTQGKMKIDSFGATVKKVFSQVNDNSPLGLIKAVVASGFHVIVEGSIRSVGGVLESLTILPFVRQPSEWASKFIKSFYKKSAKLDLSQIDIQETIDLLEQKVAQVSDPILKGKIEMFLCRVKGIDLNAFKDPREEVILKSQLHSALVAIVDDELNEENVDSDNTKTPEDTAVSAAVEEGGSAKDGEAEEDAGEEASRADAKPNAGEAEKHSKGTAPDSARAVKTATPVNVEVSADGSVKASEGEGDSSALSPQESEIINRLASDMFGEESRESSAGETQQLPGDAGAGSFVAGAPAEEEQPEAA